MFKPTAAASTALRSAAGEGHQRSDMVPMLIRTIQTRFCSSISRRVCDILDPVSGEPYNRDPRGTSRGSAGLSRDGKNGDTVFVGPEPEFSCSTT